MRYIRKRRNLRKRFAVLGDGITEQWYLKHLKDFKEYRYKISPSLFANVGIEKAAPIIDGLLAEGYDHVTYLTDYDSIISQGKQEQFEKFIHKYSKRKKVLICETMPAIELWFLLHFTFTSREFPDCNQVERELKRYLPEYEKRKSFLEKKAWFEEMVQGQSVAIERAEQLLKQMSDGNTGVHFPYSRIPEALLEFERQKK
ncbi:RloB domain-containing protein [Maribellus comscasis]|uniref:RloB domain-containing protein n=1 Tax=Maribellus comscasis TaxID=2681766 RepID=A0A6I6JXE9_9BACT|nr:RloB family protein [Maribellus comscasis]QGY47765.1 RloB domain-containing protein [Maribellus comscasis]